MEGESMMGIIDVPRKHQSRTFVILLKLCRVNNDKIITMVGAPKTPQLNALNEAFTPLHEK